MIWTDGNFNLHIDLGASAMSTPRDIANALRRTAQRLETGVASANLMDMNGNTVGRWEFEATIASTEANR